MKQQPPPSASVYTVPSAHRVRDIISSPFREACGLYKVPATPYIFAFRLTSRSPRVVPRIPPVLVHMARAPRTRSGADAPTRAATGWPLRDHQRHTAGDATLLKTGGWRNTRARTATAAAPTSSLRDARERCDFRVQFPRDRARSFPFWCPRAAGVSACRRSFDEVCPGVETLSAAL